MSDSPLHVVFAGTPEFAVPTLKALLDDPAFIVDLVITQPDKPVGRKHVLTPPPVKVVAEEAGITVEQPENINDFGLQNLEFDFLVVVAYGQILSQEVLDCPRIAPVNIHFSLLPEWRGAAPVQHAMLAGQTVTGITIQRMAKKLDTGNILAQEEVPIPELTYAEDVYTLCGQKGATLLTQTLKNPLEETEQDHSKATFCKKLTREMGSIDPTQISAQQLHSTVYALVPWPGVLCKIDGQEVKILETRLEEEPGTIPLQCKDSVLHIKTLQPPGKTAMSSEAWLRGRK